MQQTAAFGRGALGEGKGMNQNLFVIAAVGVIIALSLAGRARAKRHKRMRMASAWGSGEEAHRLDADDLRDIGAYCRAREVEEPCAVDAVTWNDLNMDDVFAQMDRACSNAGEEVLYDLLHRTDAPQEVLQRRSRIVRAAQEEETARVAMRMALCRLGHGRYHGAHGYLFRPKARRVEHGGFYLALGLAPFAIALLALLISPRVLLALIPAFAVNLCVYYRTSRLFMSELASIRHIASVIETARQLCECMAPSLGDVSAQMGELIRALRPVRRWSGLFAMQRVSDFDFLTDYLRIFFQMDMICLWRLSRCFERENASLRKLYAMVGEIDACMAIASFRADVRTVCDPTFTDEMCIRAQGLVHPLIQKPVPNDICWTGSVLVTGSNASGKSTWIKALAVNAILAQTVGTCMAASFALPRARVMTSMALRDSLMGSESYFVVEVRSLRRLLEAVQSGARMICMIDEILRGTNTVERIAASSTLLEALDRENCLCMAATHDQELTRLLRRFRQIHFSETIVEGGMVFSYKLLEGPSDTRNALLLMRQMGFPREMTRQAERRAQTFDETGQWA